MVDFTDSFVVEHLPDVTYIRILAPKLAIGADQPAGIGATLGRLIQGGKEPLVLDLNSAEVDSSFIGMLILMRRSLRQSLEAAGRAYEAKQSFTCCRDKTETLAVIRSGAHDAILLCGINAGLRALLVVMRLM